MNPHDHIKLVDLGIEELASESAVFTENDELIIADVQRRVGANSAVQMGVVVADRQPSGRCETVLVGQGVPL